MWRCRNNNKTFLWWNTRNVFTNCDGLSTVARIYLNWPWGCMFHRRLVRKSVDWKNPKQNGAGNENSRFQVTMILCLKHVAWHQNVTIIGSLTMQSAAKCLWRRMALKPFNHLIPLRTNSKSEIVHWLRRQSSNTWPRITKVVELFQR
jgi:hypothetical protein